MEEVAALQSQRGATLENHVCVAASFVLGGSSSDGEGVLLAHTTGHLR